MTNGVNNNGLNKHIDIKLDYSNPSSVTNNSSNDDLIFDYGSSSENIIDDTHENISPQSTLELSKEEQISILNSSLMDARDNQGFFGSIWNGIKCFTGLGTSTKKCEKAISDFNNGKISYEEAQSIINSFSSKQEESVNLGANIVSGAVVTVAVGSAVLTGGVTLAAIGIGALLGAVTKAGIKVIDRATNNVKGDALDTKEIVRDSLSGAVDGAISTATMGIGTTSLAGTEAGKATLKQIGIQGAKAGALDGAISGAVTGASDYTIDALINDDKDFNVNDLVKITTVNTVAGAVTGGVMGGASSVLANKVHQNAMMEMGDDIDDSLNELVEIKNIKHADSKTAETLSSIADNQYNTYSKQIAGAKEQIEDVFHFGEDKSVVAVSARPKSSDSIFAKLEKKFLNKKLGNTSPDKCLEAIGDGLGTRVQMRSLTNEEAHEVLDDFLAKRGITFDEFRTYLSADKSSLSPEKLINIGQIETDAINMLKEKQTASVFNSLREAIAKKKLHITELNNYGDSVTSYFTPSQVVELADTYYDAYGKKLTVVTEMSDYYGEHAKIQLNTSPTSNEPIVLQGDDLIGEHLIIKTKGAIKDSGYASAQMNVVHMFKNGEKGLGELQLRGTALNEFADAEHIPYDILSGKLVPDTPLKAKYYDIISNMTKAEYAKYLEYTNAVYNYSCLSELQLAISREPVITDFLPLKSMDAESLFLLSKEGLIQSNKLMHSH